MNILDSVACGAFKQEKYVRRGYFLGAKFYALQCIEIKSMGVIYDNCKMKGVQAKYRRFRDYEQMHEALFSIGETFAIDMEHNIVESYVKLFN